MDGVDSAGGEGVSGDGLGSGCGVLGSRERSVRLLQGLLHVVGVAVAEHSFGLAATGIFLDGLLLAQIFKVVGGQDVVWRVGTVDRP